MATFSLYRCMGEDPRGGVRWKFKGEYSSLREAKRHMAVGKRDPDDSFGESKFEDSNYYTVILKNGSSEWYQVVTNWKEEQD